MTKLLQRLVCVTGLALGAWGFQASAGDISCTSTAIGSSVLPNDGCSFGHTSNDTLGSPPIQVNIDQMFGGGWTFAEKWEYNNSSWAQDDEAFDIGLAVVGTGKVGTWSISQIWEDVMLVLKGPNPTSGALPDVYVGYLLEDNLVAADLTGTYSSPFYKTKNGTVRIQDISHISAYVRGVAVPEPGSLALLGFALIALGIAGLRRPQPAR